MDQLTRLALQARAGDEDALDTFVSAAYDHVWRFCAALVDRQSAEDLTQETFIRAVRALPRYRGDSSARTWLLGIARHVCLGELRTRTRRRRRDATLETSATPTSVDPCEEITVHDLLSGLDPDRRAAFVLTQLLGLSYDQAAAVCDCPPGTIRSRVSRARSDLIKLLGDATGNRRHGGTSMSG